SEASCGGGPKTRAREVGSSGPVMRALAPPRHPFLHGARVDHVEGQHATGERPRRGTRDRLGSRPPAAARATLAPGWSGSVYGASGSTRATVVPPQTLEYRPDPSEVIFPKLPWTVDAAQAAEPDATAPPS